MFSHNIAVTMVCPGPVFSDIRKFSYTEKIGKVRNRECTQFCRDFLTISVVIAM